MMLVKCPECDLQVSDKALSCPHCGLPMVKTTLITKRNSKKHKRLPNGFGQITQLKNKQLRNPYRAMITVGTNPDTGKPICKLLKPTSYFPTYNAAYEALMEYNKHPYELDSIMTINQLYENWSNWYFSTLKSKNSQRTITAAWKYCSSLYNINAKDLRAYHIKECMEKGFVLEKGEKKYPSSNIKSRIKSLFNLMLDYGEEHEIVDKNYARTFEISKDITKDIEKSKKDHISFTDEEMEILWKNIDIPYVDIILFQCYTGWRPQELGLIKLENVNMIDWTIKGGMKTDAGRDRVVPIHPKVQEIVKKNQSLSFSLDHPYLFSTPDGVKGNKYFLSYDKYSNRFENIITQLKLNPEHRPHDPRKQFVTMCKKYNVDQYAIKYMVGHKIDDITEKIYTDHDIDWYRSELLKIM